MLHTTNYQTIKIPCSLCHQSGHNKRTCSLATDEGMEDCEYCGYTHHYEDKCPNEATAHHYEKWRVDEEDDYETVSVESEDTCECCGRPYDHRNPHRQSEMCDCVQNDDGTLSRPKEEDEESIPEVKDCGHFFDCGCGMTVCGECDEDMCDNEACAIYYTYRNDACMCDGCDFCEWKIRIRKSGLKLTPPFIPENQKENETNWNEDGDDELCSAIDASGNALY